MAKKAKNERITEDIVRDLFKNDPLFNVIKLEEQRSSVPKARKCLEGASKSLTGEPGYPEFIISFPALPDDIIVVECKADTKFHESSDHKKPLGYAVDGALHYSGFLAREYNVIAIAVSGEDKSKTKVSTFFQPKGEKMAKPEDKKLLDIYSYIKKFEGEIQAKRIESGSITKIAIEFNKELNDYSIVEYDRCTLISAILLALQNPAFKDSYAKQARSNNMEPTPARLAGSIISSIKKCA